MANDMGTGRGLVGFRDDLNNLLYCYMIFFRSERDDTKITRKNVHNARFLKTHYHAVRAFHELHIRWATEGQETDPMLIEFQDGVREKLAAVDDLQLNINQALGRYDWLFRMTWVFGGLVAAAAAPWTGPFAPIVGIQLAGVAREMIDAML